MNLPAKESNPRQFAGRLMTLLALGLIVIGYMVWRRPTTQPKPQPLAQAPAVVTNSSTMTNLTHSPAASSRVLANRPDFQERPFPVAYESAKVQWTLADGKDTNVIRQLAHNPLEYDRMVEENPRIFKRQLVYLKQTAASVFEQAKLRGEKVRQLTLPGVDGQELQFEIVKSDGSGSSRQGMFNGRLVGNLDSQVSFAFQDGREAFTVLSPKENIFVVGEPREAGQVMVKAIDPNTYGLGPVENAEDVNPAPASK